MKKFFQFFNRYQEVFYRLVLFFAFVFFISLSWKNPYNDTSLIGNFDPFPDTMHYVVPARNFVLTGKFALEHNGLETIIHVPPLYSLSLIPGYFINSDARTFYFINLILGLISIYLLYKISRRLSQSPFITGLILFLYTGTFVIFWQTQLAMSENILLPVTLGFLLICLYPLNYKNLIIGTALAIGFYGSKFAAIPCSIFALIYLFFRILFIKNKTKKCKYLLIFFLTSVFVVLLINHQEIIGAINRLFSVISGKTSAIESNMTWFGFNNIGLSFQKYFNALMGYPIYNLWETKTILPFGLSSLVLIWCLYALDIKKYRKISFLILGLTIFQLLFLSLIVMIEGRYAFVFLPVIYTGLAAFCGWGKEFLEKHFGQNKTIIITLFLVILSASAFSFYHFSEWKTQLLVNFQGSERPWWHIALVKEDQILQERHSDATNTFLISVMAPFFWDLYQQGNYKIAPFLSDQDFYNSTIWQDVGLNNIAKVDLPAFYASQSAQGKEIYLSTIGFNENNRRAITAYEKLFNFEILDENCGNLCQLFKLELKN